jgi:hypothetical protein
MTPETKDKVKNGFIIVLVILIVMGGVFGGRAVKKFRDEVSTLKSANTALGMENIALEGNIVAEQAKVVIRDKQIDSLMIEFRKKEQQITVISADLGSALAKLNSITSDSSYIFLTQVAYKFPGVMKYLFNELQVKGIHADYLKARSAEKIIPEYAQQIENCKLQIATRDYIETGLKTIINTKDQQLTNCEKINQNNDQIIKDVEKQRDKEKHRKNFWRFTASVATGVAIIVAVFGL